MDIYFKLLNFVLDLIFPLLAGYLIGHFTNISNNKLDKLILSSMYFFYPLMCLISSWELPLSKDIILIPFLGIFSLFVAGFSAFILLKFKNFNSLEKGSYFLSAMLSNRGTIGSIAIFILFGETGYALANLTFMLDNFILFGFCYPMAQYYRQEHEGIKKNISIKDMLLNPKMLPFLGLFIGISFNLIKIDRPIILGTIFPWLVHVAAWGSLLPIGALINFKEMKKYWLKGLDIIPLKFVIVPLVTYLVTQLIISDPLIIKTITIIAGTPTAINAVVATRINKLNIHLSTASFVLTTVVYILFIFPILLFI